MDVHIQLLQRETPPGQFARRMWRVKQGLESFMVGEYVTPMAVDVVTEVVNGRDHSQSL